MEFDVVIVGAGLAGLAAARALSEVGARAVVVERSSGVGGRCATRRIDGQPVDHGLAFLHGREERFLAAVEGAGPDALVGWPRLVEGRGVPCQPEAFAAAERRLAYRAGLTALPKRLARDLDVRLGATVTALRPIGTPSRPRIEVEMSGGGTLAAPRVLLAMPVPQADALLAPLAAASPGISAARTVMRTVRWASCLAVIARYGKDVRPPAWDVAYPESSEALHAVFHDSTKRGPGATPTLVLQARPAFSREAMDDPPERWGRRLLEEAAATLGSWIASPTAQQAHRWRHARVHRATELAAPIALDPGGGATLALCGDAFDPAGGAEGAFLSGLAAARRLVAC